MRQITEQADHAVEEAEIDGERFPGRMPVLQGGQDGDGRPDSAAEIADRQAEFGRRPVRFAVDRHDTAERLGHQVEGWLVAEAGFLTVARDRTDNQIRIDRVQRLDAKAQPVHHPRPEILHHGVAVSRQIEQDGSAARRARVQREAFLVPVDCQEVMAFAALIGWDIACLIAAVDLFDLDDLGAQITQDHGAERPGQDPGQIQDA